jgi:hypothetical protein
VQQEIAAEYGSAEIEDLLGRLHELTGGSSRVARNSG